MPTAVRNNTEGDADAAVRERFDEPSWNNPVVRFLDDEHADLVPRLHGRAAWTRAALLDGMVRALEAADAEVPAWLRLIAAEERAHARGVEVAVFGMP